MGQVLYHNIHPPSSADIPHNVAEERLSLDVDELLISQSFEEETDGRRLSNGFN